MAAMSERKAHPPMSARLEFAASRASARILRQERGEDLLAVGLADFAEPHRGGDGVGDKRQHEGLEARFDRQAVARRGGGDGGRIGDALLACELAQGLAVPGRAGGGDERRPLRRRLRRRSAEGASATASALVSRSAGQSPASTARKRRRTRWRRRAGRRKS